MFVARENIKYPKGLPRFRVSAPPRNFASEVRAAVASEWLGLGSLGALRLVRVWGLGFRGFKAYRV